MLYSFGITGETVFLPRYFLKRIFGVLLLLSLSLGVFPQSDLCGKVHDENDSPLPGAHVTLAGMEISSITNEKGEFCFRDLAPGTYQLHISYLGYMCMHHCDAEIGDSDLFLSFQLFPEKVKLPEVEVSDQPLRYSNNPAMMPKVSAQQGLIRQNLHGSLMKSLESLPGVRAMEIGQGVSKPVIRGLSFHRVAVIHHGIKQEGQQWGADHGLEIDQFDQENVEILKGPSSLLYGSDAIGGTVLLPLPSVAAESTLNGSADLLARSVNNTAGGSLMLKGNRNGKHFRFRYTRLDYGDYKIPADSFYYNQFRLPVYNSILKNTAGSEQNINLHTGYIQSRFSLAFSLSHYHSKVGFFPGSHGIPDAARLVPDSSNRNIELPFQDVVHWKIQFHSVYFFTDHKVSLHTGIQKNLREEWSKFHTHYPNQEPPSVQPDLELLLDLKTLSANLLWQSLSGEGAEAGINLQHQDHSTGGYMFLIPPFRRMLAGTFVRYGTTLKPNLKVMGGIRYDYGRIQIDSVFSLPANRVKSDNLIRTYNDLTWSAGIEYYPKPAVRMTFNVGKGFRVPTAMELSANGIHHGSFRYELGDSTLVSEHMYQADLGLEWEHKGYSIAFHPFFSYAPDYIFLSPTGGYLLPDGSETAEADAGQVYQYTQSEALRSGFEFITGLPVTSELHSQIALEYVYATDLTYPLPFTPPFTLKGLIRWQWPSLLNDKIRGSTDFQVIHAFDQNRNARNELPTPGYTLLNLSLQWKVTVGRITPSFVLQIQNLLDTKYFNHLNFYRMIELPEAGRNLQLQVHIPF